MLLVDEAQVVSCAKTFVNDDVIPVFVLSSVTGEGFFIIYLLFITEIIFIFAPFLVNEGGRGERLLLSY